MTDGQEIFVGAGETPQSLALKFSNRHGLIAGATGTGKTITLQILAEGFSNAGVPVFLADVMQGTALMTMLIALLFTNYRIRVGLPRHG